VEWRYIAQTRNWGTLLVSKEEKKGGGESKNINQYSWHWWGSTFEVLVGNAKELGSTSQWLKHLTTDQKCLKFLVTLTP
jgi:hypothetical protein